MNQRHELTQDRYTHTSGEFTRMYGWHTDDEGREEPVMLLYRSHYRTEVPFGVPLRAAYRFTEGGHVMRCAFAALDHFGMLVTKDSAVKLATMIQDGLHDLIHMPPKPKTVDRKRDEPDAVITVNGVDKPIYRNH